MIGCFLYAKLLRDIICLIAGGALIYSIVRWRHFVFFLPAWPMAKLVTYNTYEGKKYRFEARSWTRKTGKVIKISLVVLWALVVLTAIGCGLWPILKDIYHLYVVC